MTGFAVYTAVIINANIMVLIIAKVWSIALYGTIITFLGMYCAVNYTMSKWYNFPVLPDNIYFGIEERVMHNPNILNVLLLVFGSTMLIEIAYSNYQCTISPPHTVLFTFSRFHAHG